MIAAEVVRHTTFNEARLKEATQRGFLDATVLAEYLVGKGIPFREAHQHVGRLVTTAEQKVCELADLSLGEFQKVCSKVESDVFDYLGASNVVARYQSEGNAGPESTACQIEFWKKQLAPAP